MTKLNWNHWRARHMGGGVIQLYEAHASLHECLDFCAARKEHLGTPVNFFPVSIAQEHLPAKKEPHDEQASSDRLL
jgi:hypothetical protein